MRPPPFERLKRRHCSVGKQNKADLAALEDYLEQFALKTDNPTRDDEKTASLVNAYNAFMLRWILVNYPTESVWSLKDSFTDKRNEIAGRKVSFDDIEHGALRPLVGYRAHAVLVCAARSCPPLPRSAYTGDRFEEQDDRAYRVWLAREDLNKFSPGEQKMMRVYQLRLRCNVLTEPRRSRLINKADMPASKMNAMANPCW